MERLNIAKEGGRHHAETQTQRGLEWPIAWLSQAYSLERGADILWQEFERDCASIRNNEEPESYVSVAAQFMLLAGLATENLLKAICIKRLGAFSTTGRFKFGHHDFVKLANESGVEFTTTDSELIQRFEHFVLFAGRYPAPKEPEALLPRVHPDGGWGSLSFVKSSDYSNWKSLFNKLCSVLNLTVAANSRPYQSNTSL